MKPLLPGVPGPLSWALLVSAGMMAFLVYDQIFWWQTRDDYVFGFIVPLFVLYVVYDRWPKFTAALKTPLDGPAHHRHPVLDVLAGLVGLLALLGLALGWGEAAAFASAQKLGGPALAILRGGLLLAVGTALGLVAVYFVRGLSAAYRALAWAAIGWGGFLFLFGSLIRANQGAQTPSSFALAVSTGFISLALIYLCLPRAEGPPEAPAGPRPSLGRDLFFHPRWRTTMMFLFPAMIWCISAPLLGIVEQQLNIFLLGKVTYVVYNAFNFAGIPIIQEGNVLLLGFDANGNESRVGVEDACSGIRSLTACIFAGSFLAAVFLESYWRKVAMLVTAALLAVVTNLFRSLFLTAWAYNNGAGSIEGTVHDATGYAVLGVTCVLLLCLLPVFTLKVRFGPPPPTPPPAPAAAG